MPRWEPDARGRLERAAMELYVERGYEATTVESIAQRAGLAERTFFRHFADKREVLFARSGALQDFLVRAVADAPEAAGPLEALVAALQDAAPLFPAQRAEARRRQQVIAGTGELTEREQTKLASLSAALSGALRERGVGDPTAHVAAELGVVVFKVAYARWVDEDATEDFPHLVRRSFDDVAGVAAG